MGSTKKSKEQSKADFVLGLPKDLPRKEVVAKGKEAGITLTENYVSQVRSTRGTKSATKAKAKTTPERPAAKNGSDSAQKAGFVAKFPATKPATEIVKEARKAGLTMSEKFVYRLRRNGKGSPRKKRAKEGAVARATPAPARVSARTPSGHEGHFAAAIVDLGFEQAQAVLLRVRDRILRAAAT
jgi:hypothetical protein